MAQSSSILRISSEKRCHTAIENVDYQPLEVNFRGEMRSRKMDML